MREAYQGENQIELNLTVSGDVKMLRIDPARDAWMVTSCEMTFNGESVPVEKRKIMITNGKLAKPAEKTGETYQPSIVFATMDPNINISVGELARKAENILYARMEIVRLPMKMAQDMAGAVKKLI